MKLTLGCLMWGIFAVSSCHGMRALNTARRLLGLSPEVGVSLGPNNFGDLMDKGGCETTIVVDGAYAPLERVVLTANGNLQRIMSAYYGASVVVDVLLCDKIAERVYDREVDLLMGGQKFCNAKGKIELLDDDCVEAVESKQVGVGQLFRYLGLLPDFELIEVGRTDKGELWRTYVLSNAKISCTFTETFVPGFADLKPPLQ